MHSTNVTAGDNSGGAAAAPAPVNANGKSTGEENGECGEMGGARDGSGGEAGAGPRVEQLDAVCDGPVRPAASNGSTTLQRSVFINELKIITN